MKLWILITCIQVMANFFPFMEAPWIYRRMRCWVRGCQCLNYHTPKDSTHHLKRLLENEMMKMEFINTGWNLFERKNLTKAQRVVKDVNAYFNGYKGPV